MDSILMSKTFFVASSILLISWLGLLGACSVIYNVQQDTALSACEKLDDWNQRTECKKRHQTSFADYEKQRKEVIKKGAE
jgi:3-hydroxy-3-methylglutaryl CoA synthase